MRERERERAWDACGDESSGLCRNAGLLSLYRSVACTCTSLACTISARELVILPESLSLLLSPALVSRSPPALLHSLPLPSASAIERRTPNQQHSSRGKEAGSERTGSAREGERKRQRRGGCSEHLSLIVSLASHFARLRSPGTTGLHSHLHLSLLLCI